MILTHFRTHDPVIHKIFLQHGVEELKKRAPSEYFVALVREIVYQQLSGKAASTIWGRIESLFPHKTVTPAYLLSLDTELLRKAGTSYAKISYIKNIAHAVVDNKLQFDQFAKMDDEAVIAALSAIKGIGRWTAEMFTMFSLGREDLFSYGDAGLQRAFRRLYRVPEYSKKHVDPIINRWRPYRTYGCLALWASIDGGM